MTVRFIHEFTGYIMMGASTDAQFVSLSAMEEAWFELRAFSVHILYLLAVAGLLLSLSDRVASEFRQLGHSNSYLNQSWFDFHSWFVKHIH